MQRFGWINDDSWLLNVELPDKAVFMMQVCDYLGDAVQG
jgi:hypothetical protein